MFEKLKSNNEKLRVKNEKTQVSAFFWETWGDVIHAFFFIRDTFIRDRMLSTGNLGKNKRCSVLNFFDVRDESENLTFLL